MVHDIAYKGTPTPAPLSPQMLQHLVHRDAIQPCFKSRPTIESVEFPKHPEKDLLQGISGLISPHDPDDQPVNSLLTSFVKLSLGIPTSLSASTHEMIEAWLNRRRFRRYLGLRR